MQNLEVAKGGGKMWFLVTRAEYEEFRRRLQQEDDRQNKRIDILETSVKEWGSLTTSVHELALSMKNMLKEQEHQGKRLEVLEKRDGEKWRQVTSYVITTLIGAAIGFCLKHIGM